MTLDHKKKFRESPYAKQWHDASASEWFHAGLATGMLEVYRNLPQPQEMGAAAANAFRLQGAQKLIDILLALTETKPETVKRYEQNLDHSA